MGKDFFEIFTQFSRRPRKGSPSRPGWPQTRYGRLGRRKISCLRRESNHHSSGRPARVSDAMAFYSSTVETKEREPFFLKIKWIQRNHTCRSGEFPAEHAAALSGIPSSVLQQVIHAPQLGNIGSHHSQFKNSLSLPRPLFTAVVCQLVDCF